MFSPQFLTIGGAAAFLLAAAPPAHAAGAVFGGTTSDDEPIVLTADAKGTTLKSAVVAWSAKCTAEKVFAIALALSPVDAAPGFTPGARDLAMTRNRQGRFAGRELFVESLAGLSAAVTVDAAGKLSATRASGTLHATVRIADATTGAPVDTCDSGTLRFAAGRGAGTIYGGKTSQEEPVVLRVDPKRRMITDALAGWDTHACTPDSAFHFGDTLGRFPLKRTGGFGDSWSNDFTLPGGEKRHMAYAVLGRVTSKAAKGSLHVAFDDADATGAQTLGCDSGGITFKAATG